MPIAGPRLAGGNRCVMNASVCGVISAAPRPCTARAVISISTLPDRPHHSEAPVNTTSPARNTRFGPKRSPSRLVNSIGTA